MRRTRHLKRPAEFSQPVIQRPGHPPNPTGTPDLFRDFGVRVAAGAGQLHHLNPVMSAEVSGGFERRAQFRLRRGGMTSLSLFLPMNPMGAETAFRRASYLYHIIEQWYQWLDDGKRIPHVNDATRWTIQ